MSDEKRRGMKSFAATLVVNKYTGIAGMQDDSEIFEPDEDLLVKIVLNIHESAWEPVKIGVTVPEDYAHCQQVAGNLEAVEVPAELIAAVDKGRFSPELTISSSGGIMVAFKRLVDKAIHALRTDSEKRQVEIKRLKERLAELEGEREAEDE